LVSYRKRSSRVLKLADCTVHGPGSGAELFIVEGDSASMAATQARNAGFQAVLPMQGKPLNAVRASDRKVAADPFYRALTEPLGTGWGDACDPGKLRYERVVRAPMGEIRCDGDAAPVLAFSVAQFQSICDELRERGYPGFTALRYRGLGSLDRSAL
jgi:DNA gyrase/topoisomerase IV subunit B